MRQLIVIWHVSKRCPSLKFFAQISQDLPLTNIAGKHAVVASFSGTPIQLRTLGRSMTGRILLEHMTCNEIYVECNHGNVRDASCFRKTI